MWFYRITRNANRNARAGASLTAPLTAVIAVKQLALLSSLRHFRRLLRALGTSVVSGVASRPPIEAAPRARALPARALHRKQTPSVPLFRHSRMNGLTNRDNALRERLAGVLAFTFIVSEHDRNARPFSGDEREVMHPATASTGGGAGLAAGQPVSKNTRPTSGRSPGGAKESSAGRRGVREKFEEKLFCCFVVYRGDI